MIYKSIDDKHGFTLIELSIVLMIISLIVGGVLAGRALIQQAEVRSTASKLQQFETAYRTFQTKYNCVPGDCLNATDFFGNNYVVVTQGCPPSGGAGNGNGNGDGFIDLSSGLTSNGTWKCEPTQALKSLSLSGLLAGDMTNPCQGTAVYFKFSGENCAYFYKDDIYNQATPALNLNSISLSTIPSGSFSDYGPALSPVQARLIDEKIDDGKPSTGKFRGLDYWITGGILINNSCSASGNYNLNEDNTCRVLYYFK